MLDWRYCCEENEEDHSTSPHVHGIPIITLASEHLVIQSIDDDVDDQRLKLYESDSITRFWWHELTSGAM